MVAQNWVTLQHCGYSGNFNLSTIWLLVIVSQLPLSVIKSNMLLFMVYPFWDNLFAANPSQPLALITSC